MITNEDIQEYLKELLLLEADVLQLVGKCGLSKKTNALMRNNLLKKQKILQLVIGLLRKKNV